MEWIIIPLVIAMFVAGYFLTDRFGRYLEKIKRNKRKAYKNSKSKGKNKNNGK